MEIMYKSEYFTKKSLGGMYELITRLMSQKIYSDRIRERVTFQDLVSRNIDRVERAREQEIIQDMSATRTNIVNSSRFDIYEMDVTGAIVPAGQTIGNSMGIYVLKPRRVPTTTNGNKAVPVNTLIVRST